LKKDNEPLLKEYELKKENLENRIKYCEDLAVKIEECKKKI
jgi:hypothetical protein